jgi:hypothetical protein
MSQDPLILLGWADTTQLLNQVIHPKAQPDALPLYVPASTMPRVRQVQGELNESLQQMPQLEPVVIAPDTGEAHQPGVLAALQAYEEAHAHLSAQCCSNPVRNAWGNEVDMTKLNHAHELAQRVLRGEPGPAVISIQEAWEAAGGNPGITPGKEELLTALRLLDEVCDEADEQSKRARTWCQYVAGMVFGWLEMLPKLPEEEACTAAIAGIIERRLWALPVGHGPKDMKQQACAELRPAGAAQPAQPTPAQEEWATVPKGGEQWQTVPKGQAQPQGAGEVVACKPFAYMDDDVAAGVLNGSYLLSAAIRGAPGGTFNFPLYVSQQAAPAKAEMSRLSHAQTEALIALTKAGHLKTTWELIRAAEMAFCVHNGLALPDTPPASQQAAPTPPNQCDTCGALPANNAAQAVPEGWHIALTGGDELVVRGPADGPGSLTIPAQCEGTLPVRILDALCRSMLRAAKVDRS